MNLLPDREKNEFFIIIFIILILLVCAFESLTPDDYSVVLIIVVLYYFLLFSNIKSGNFLITNWNKLVTTIVIFLVYNAVTPDYFINNIQRWQKAISNPRLWQGSFFDEILFPLIIIYLFVTLLWWLSFSERKNKTDINLSKKELFFRLDKYPKRIFLMPLFGPYLVAILVSLMRINCTDGSACGGVVLFLVFAMFFVFIFCLIFSVRWYIRHKNGKKVETENNSNNRL